MSSNINSTVNVDTSQIIQGAGKITLDGVDIGSFRDGVTITYNADYSFTRSDYALGEIDGEPTTAECTVNTILEQNTARNMCIALGANTSSSSSSSSSVRFDFGPEMGLQPKQLIVTGMSAMDKNKGARYTFFRVLRIGQTAQTLRRGVEQLLPVSFKVLLNTDGYFFRREEPIPLADL